MAKLCGHKDDGSECSVATCTTVRIIEVPPADSFPEDGLGSGVLAGLRDVANMQGPRFYTGSPRMRGLEMSDEGLEKYAVEIEPEKPGEKTAGKRPKDPRKNVPHDPEKGTEPYEKKPKK